MCDACLVDVGKLISWGLEGGNGGLVVHVRGSVLQQDVWPSRCRREWRKGLLDPLRYRYFDGFVG